MKIILDSKNCYNNGTVSVESKPGDGTVIYIVLSTDHKSDRQERKRAEWFLQVQINVTHHGINDILRLAVPRLTVEQVRNFQVQRIVRLNCIVNLVSAFLLAMLLTLSFWKPCTTIHIP